MVTLFLTFVITKFAPIAVFMLLVRTFASYGIDYLKPALVYVVTTTATLLAFWWSVTHYLSYLRQN